MCVIPIKSDKGDKVTNATQSMPCNRCNRSIASLTCTACRSVRYCNRTCQRQDWCSHRDPCREQQIRQLLEAIFSRVLTNFGETPRSTLSRHFRRWLQKRFDARIGTIPHNCVEFQRAVTSYPNLLYEKEKEYIYTRNFEVPSDFREQRVVTRWENMICRNCSYRDCIQRDRRRSWHVCTNCCLEFYCSTKCLEADRSRHRGFCVGLPNILELEPESPHELAIMQVPI